VDALVEVLSELDVPYDIEELGRVRGVGLNDIELEDGSSPMYPIRRLEYSDYVVLEQMQRHPDCDTDDIIVS